MTARGALHLHQAGLILGAQVGQLQQIFSGCQGGCQGGIGGHGLLWRQVGQLRQILCGC